MSIMPINYKHRLDAALKYLGDQALVIFSQPEAVKNSDVNHPYRQESFFYYLTGLLEPESALVLLPKSLGAKSILFVRPRDVEKEIWHGKRLGVEGAMQAIPVDECYLINTIWEKLPKLLKGHEALYYNLGFDQEIDRQIIQVLNQVKNIAPRDTNLNLTVKDSFEIATIMRMQKTVDEVARMQKAADISEKAFRRVYKEVQPGMNEREVLGMLLSDYYKFGADGEAYNSIIAGGENACCLHYVENNCELKDNQLLLIDSGAQFDYYASDVTRTFPVGKKFTNAQRQLYQIVLDANIKAIEAVKPGESIFSIHQVAVACLVDGLLNLGLIKGDKAEIIQKGLFRQFYPHNTCHWLGMDVHDLGPTLVKQSGKLVNTPFQPGMVITVEPGLYMQVYDKSIPEEYRGIGIRIEDDILVTETGFVNLTRNIPKSVEEMENRI